MHNIDIRDLIGPPISIPMWDNELEEIMEKDRVLARIASHISLGLKDISNALALRVITSWDVRNDGTAAGRAGLKITIIETKGAMPDVEWFQHVPGAAGGVTGITIDLQKAETGVATGLIGDRFLELDPGFTKVLTGGAEFQGPLMSSTMASFWYDRHPTPTFKVVVEMIEIARVGEGFVRSIGTHTFPTAYNLQATRPPQSLIVSVGSPTIGAYII